MTISSFGQSIPSYVPTNGLIGWWPFNGNANDESGNGHNGAIVPGPTFIQDRCGISNSALSFECLGGVVVPNDSDFYFSSHTLSFWATTLGFCGGFSDWTIAVRKGQYYQDSSLWAGWKHGGATLQTHMGFSGGFGAQTQPAWQLITVTYDSSSSTANLYRNGALCDTHDSIIFFLSNNEPLEIGWGYDLGFGNNNVDSIGMFGYLDDIGLWNRALSTSEILGLYNSCTTNINENQISDMINFYPNPANNNITMDFGSNYRVIQGCELRITNLMGQQVFTSPITQKKFFLDLSSWSVNGSYLVYVYDSAGALLCFKKLIIQ